jgi:hypothetical protein
MTLKLLLFLGISPLSLASIIFGLGSSQFRASKTSFLLDIHETVGSVFETLRPGSAV